MEDFILCVLYDNESARKFKTATKPGSVAELRKKVIDFLELKDDEYCTEIYFHDPEIGGELVELVDINELMSKGKIRLLKKISPEAVQEQDEPDNSLPVSSTTSNLRVDHWPSPFIIPEFDCQVEETLKAANEKGEVLYPYGED